MYFERLSEFKWPKNDPAVVGYQLSAMVGLLKPSVFFDLGASSLRKLAAVHGGSIARV